MTLINDADIVVELDVGYRPPLRAVQWLEVTCEVLSMDWFWGAQQPLGPLTETENGRLRVSLHDPDRTYDPTNPDSPLYDALKVGMPMRVMVDGSPAFTGVLNSWSRDPTSVVSDLFAHDVLGEISVKMLDRGAQSYSGTTDFQVNDLLNQAAFPAERRLFLTSGGIERGGQYLKSSVLDMLQMIRYGELGALFGRRDGKIAWWNREGVTPPPVSAIINCDGAALTSMYDIKGPNRVRNRVRWSGNYGLYGGVGIPDDFIRDANPDVLDMGLAGDSRVYPLWSQIVLDALAEPSPLAVLGTIVPRGPEVKQVVCAEYGDRWEVRLDGAPTREVEVLGMSVDVVPGMLEVIAVTEDVPVDTGKRHAVVYVDYQRGNTENDDYIRSQDPVYATARAGTGAKDIPTGTGINGVGQQFFPTVDPIPQHYQMWESFLSFDTSIIPDNAVIDSVRLITWHSTFPGIPITLEARSKVWGPPIAIGDWVPGASLAALPLRASLSLVPTTPKPPDYNQFSTQGRMAWTSDPSFIGAINKTGRTELVLSTNRQRTGTLPTAGVKEVIEIYSADASVSPINSAPYLDIWYTVPVTRRFSRHQTKVYFGDA